MDDSTVRHELATRPPGAGINATCSACDDAFWIIARIPPQPFFCSRCSGLDALETP